MSERKYTHEGLPMISEELIKAYISEQSRWIEKGRIEEFALLSII